MQHTRFTAWDIALVAMCTAVLFAQEEILTFLPNIQLTVFLILLYAKKLGFVRTSLAVTIHVLLDNFVMGTAISIYLPFMWCGWMLIPLIACTVLKKINSPFPLACAAAVFALLYCWMFFIPACLIFKMPFAGYLAADLFFEFLLAASSFVSTLFLWKPCAKLFDRYLRQKAD